MKKIIRNRIKCNLCGDIIESTNRHDFVECKCGCCFVDGGLDYLRRGYTNSIDDYEEMSEFESDDFDHLQLEWLQVLKEAEEDVKNNRITSINETLMNIRKKLNT